MIVNKPSWITFVVHSGTQVPPRGTTLQPWVSVESRLDTGEPPGERCMSRYSISKHLSGTRFASCTVVFANVFSKCSSSHNTIVEVIPGPITGYHAVSTRSDG